MFCLESCKNEKDITANTAEHYGWSVSWIGMEKRGTAKDKTDSDFQTGVSDSRWKKVSNPYQVAIYVDIDMNERNFRKTPALVTSMSSNSEEWTSTGSANLFSLTRASVRVYLEDATSQHRASAEQWTVHYLGYDGENFLFLCKMLY